MTETKVTNKIEAREVLIKLADGSVVKGKINLYRGETLLERASEVFTEREEPFLVVFDATFEGKTGRVLFLNKRNILWVAPLDETMSEIFRMK